MVLGLTYSYLGGGLEFTSAICLFAGIFLITPVLFKFHFSDFKIILSHKIIFLKNILLNFIILPIIALGIGYFTGDFGIAGGLLLLSLLPGGGMVMHWIKTSNANTKLGFVIFFFNISLLFLSFSIFDLLMHNTYILEAFNTANTQFTLPIKPIGIFVKLIFIPLVLSRLILKFAPSFPSFVEKNKKIISSLTINAIVFYLFALKSSASLLTVEPILLIKSALAVIAFYLVNYIISSIIYKNTPEQTAGFWHSFMRFITISLVIATFAVEAYSYTFLLPIMMAYILQIPLAAKIADIKQKAITKNT
jgi:predicted Na+-dependent transporter